MKFQRLKYKILNVLFHLIPTLKFLVYTGALWVTILGILDAHRMAHTMMEKARADIRAAAAQERLATAIEKLAARAEDN